MSYKSDVVIKATNLSKRYRIYGAPRDRLKQFIVPRFHRLLGYSARDYFREVWALRSVSFDVLKGETVGIIGRNGSGKSTLLQIICGTLAPTNGTVETTGRIAALLSLGAGFNPEFTGRENVYMNGRILGLNQDELDDRYNQIIAFADIGPFVEQPVKTYSSGMFARLAFAVAVNVDPEVLIVDEALSVGDAGFQLKCMLKMRELQERGTTIFFVSHDTNSVVRLCDRAILLENGNILSDDRDTLRCVKMYQQLTRNTPQRASAQLTKSESAGQTYEKELKGITETRFGSREAEYLSVDFLSADGQHQAVFRSGEIITIRAVIRSHRYFASVASGFTLKNKAGVDVWGDNTNFANASLQLKPGITHLTYRFSLNLPAGEYFLYVGLADVSESRKELDQRWPVRMISVVSNRQVLGFVFAPATIEATYMGQSQNLLDVAEDIEGAR